MTDGSNTGQNGGKVQAPDAHDQAADPFPNLKDIAGSLLFYMGIPAATLYPIEAFLCLLQIMSTYGHEFWAAAYAVSLIPPSTVIMWALNDLLLAVLLAITLVVPAMLLAYVWTAKGWSAVWGRGWRKTPLRLVAAVSILVIYTGGALAFILSGLNTNDRTDIITSVTGVYWILGALASGYIIGTDHRKSKRSEGRSAVHVPARRWLARGILFSYLFNACLIIVFAGLTQPPALPEVDFDEDKRGDGLLLGVSNGHWHYLNTEGNVVAIPTDQVRTVTIYPLNSE